MKQQKHKEMAQTVKQVQDTIAKGEVWADDDFPNQYTSIYKADIDKIPSDPMRFERFRDYDWKSGSDSFRSPKLFEKEASPNDVI